MFLRNACAFALTIAFTFALTIGTWCAAQSGTDASQQSVTGGANAPAATGTPSPANDPAAAVPAQTAAPASTPAGTSPAETNTPGATGTPAGNSAASDATTSASPNNNPTTPPGMRNPSLQPSRATATSNETAKPGRISDRDPLLDLPPLPKGKVALQGGTLIRIDPVRNRILMTPFQGKREEIAFDVRTQFTRDGKTMAVRDLKPGSQIYADTIWDGQRVFAKAIRIFTSTHQDQEHGQIIGFDASNGILRVRDELFPQPVDLKVNSSTVIRKDQSVGSVADLRPGSLVAIKFQPGSKGQAYQIDVLATPGAAFVFSGPITHVDLLRHVIGISNRSDSIIYDIHFDHTRVRITPDLQEGAEVDVNATFDGSQYLANTIAIRRARAAQ